MTSCRLVRRAYNGFDCSKSIVAVCSMKLLDDLLFLVLYILHCVRSLYSSLCLLAMPATWLIVTHWCITRFSLCLSVDCESHLTGLALSSPARMRRPSRMPPSPLFWACVRDRKRMRERTKYKENEKATCVHPFSFCPWHAKGHLRQKLFFWESLFYSVLLNFLN